jgi:hypothetical protein
MEQKKSIPNILSDILFLHRNSEKRLKRAGISLLFFLLFSLCLLLLLFTVVDVYTENDTSFRSSKSVLNEENVQYQIRTNEIKFREELNKKLKLLYNDKSFALIDSIAKNSNEASSIKKYIILNKLKSDKTSVEFYSKIEKLSSPLIEIKGLKTTLEIDFIKLDNIIQASKSNLNANDIKYGNYLKTEYYLDKKLRIDYVLIVLFAGVSLFLIAFFISKIGLKSHNALNDIVDDLNYDKQTIKQVQKILSEEEISKDEILQLKKLVNKLETNLKKYEFENILESILYIDVSKSERKSLELYNRSTLMLILGLLVAILGILIFYFTLPEFQSISKPNQYLALTIRPTLLLLFVQSISFYLLKQYRSLINDYKYFHKEYLEKSKTFITYQLMQSDNISDVEMKLIDKLLQTEVKENLSNENENEVSNEKILDVLKIMIEKFK